MHFFPLTFIWLISSLHLSYTSLRNPNKIYILKAVLNIIMKIDSACQLFIQKIYPQITVKSFPVKKLFTTLIDNLLTKYSGVDKHCLQVMDIVDKCRKSVA